MSVLTTIFRTRSEIEANVVQALLESRPHSEQGYRSCLGILRHAIRSTIITSQLPRDQWHASLGDPTADDARADFIGVFYTNRDDRWEDLVARLGSSDYIAAPTGPGTGLPIEIESNQGLERGA